MRWPALVGGALGFQWSAELEGTLTERVKRSTPTVALVDSRKKKAILRCSLVSGSGSTEAWKTRARKAPALPAAGVTRMPKRASLSAAFFFGVLSGGSSETAREGGQSMIRKP